MHEGTLYLSARHTAIVSLGWSRPVLLYFVSGSIRRRLSQLIVHGFLHCRRSYYPTVNEDPPGSDRNAVPINMIIMFYFPTSMAIATSHDGKFSCGSTCSGFDINGVAFVLSSGTIVKPEMLNRQCHRTSLSRQRKKEKSAASRKAMLPVN